MNTDNTDEPPSVFVNEICVYLCSSVAQSSFHLGVL
jgi:hypothetical protein